MNECISERMIDRTNDKQNINNDFANQTVEKDDNRATQVEETEQNK